MVALMTLSFAALAVGVLAGPIVTAEKSKAFKIGVTFNNQETLYLTNTALASSNIADGIECTITSTKTGEKAAGKIACGPENKAFTYSEAHTREPLKPVASDANNVNWAIDADNVIHWGAKPTGTKSVTFSRENPKGKAKNSNKIFAEVCTTFDHHEPFPSYKNFWEKGVPKAYYV